MSVETSTVEAVMPAMGDSVAEGTVLEWHKSEGDTVAAAPEQCLEIPPPRGGESVTEGTILGWSVKVGDEVKDGDTVVEISTDKVDMELPAPGSGTIVEILAPEGTTVSVGEVIARMTTSAAAAPASDAEAGVADGTQAPAA